MTNIHRDEDPMNVAGAVLPDVPRQDGVSEIASLLDEGIRLMPLGTKKRADWTMRAIEALAMERAIGGGGYEL